MIFATPLLRVRYLPWRFVPLYIRVSSNSCVIFHRFSVIWKIL